MDNPAVFQVVFPGAGNAVPAQADLLELWQPVTTEESYLTSSEQPGLVWYANLPDDPYETVRLLDNHALALRQTSLALDAVGPLLIQDLRQAAGEGRAGYLTEGRMGYELSTGAASGHYDLVAQALNYNPESVSFGLQDELANAVEIVSRFVGSVHRLVDQFALVESGRGGQRTARTRVDWLGDMDTWWTPGSPASAIADHRRVLAQALATRQEWLRLVTLLTVGAAKVGLAMAAGPFNPVAIWTAWKYVQKVVEQYRALCPVSTPTA